MEFLLAAMGALTAAALVAALGRKDRLVAARVALLRPIHHGEARESPSFALKALGLIGKRLPGDRTSVIRAMSGAGLQGIPGDAFVGASVVSGLLGALIGLQFGDLAGLATPTLSIVGYRMPAAYLSFRRKGRNEEIARQVPDAAELLAICTQGGLNVSLALSRVAFRTPGLLGEELRRTLSEIDFGVARREALDQLAGRSQVEELKSLIAVLNGADRFGTRVATALSGFASDLRRKQKRVAEEEARRAPVKLLFPLVFLILPAFILLTIVPLLLGTFRTFGF